MGLNKNYGTFEQCFHYDKENPEVWETYLNIVENVVKTGIANNYSLSTIKGQAIIDACLFTVCHFPFSGEKLNVYYAVKHDKLIGKVRGKDIPLIPSVKEDATLTHYTSRFQEWDYDEDGYVKGNVTRIFSATNPLHQLYTTLSEKDKSLKDNDKWHGIYAAMVFDATHPELWKAFKAEAHKYSPYRGWRVNEEQKADVDVVFTKAFIDAGIPLPCKRADGVVARYYAARYSNRFPMRDVFRIPQIEKYVNPVYMNENWEPIIEGVNDLSTKKACKKLEGHFLRELSSQNILYMLVQNEDLQGNTIELVEVEGQTPMSCNVSEVVNENLFMDLGHKDDCRRLAINAEWPFFEKKDWFIAAAEGPYAEDGDFVGTSHRFYLFPEATPTDPQKYFDFCVDRYDIYHKAASDALGSEVFTTSQKGISSPASKMHQLEARRAEAMEHHFLAQIVWLKNKFPELDESKEHGPIDDPSYNGELT